MARNIEFVRAARNRWYAKNKKKQIARQAARKKEMFAWAAEMKRTLHCNRCDESHPACLQFHHRDPVTKDRGIGEMINDGMSRERIEEEMAKCEVLCANCHFKHHWNEKHTPLV